MRSRRKIDALLCVLLALVLPRLSAAQDLITLALSGQSVQLPDGESIFGPIGHPLINDRGDVSFVGVTIDDFVRWKVDQHGTIQPVVINGQSAPGSPAGMVFGPLNYPLQLDNHGNGAFFAGVILPPPGSNETGVWLESDGGFQNLALTDAPMPGIPARYVPWSFGQLLHGAEGHVALDALLDDTQTSALTSRRAIWAGSDSLQLVATIDMPVHGMANGTRFANLQSVRAVNSSGDTIFTGTMSGPGITSGTNTAGWIAGPNGMQMVVRAGDVAPDSDGAQLGDIFTFDVGMNDAKQFVFRANLVGPSVTSTNSEAIFAGDGTTLRKVAQQGDLTPIAGLTYSDDMSRSVINAQGDVAFYSSVQDGPATDHAIWSEGLGGLHLVARQSDQAPGLPPGQGFGQMLAGSSEHVINAAGQVAFAAGNTGQGYFTGIWAEDRSGVLHLIAHQHQSIEVSPGNFLSVLELQFKGDSGSQDGRARSFNDRGQVVFSARLSDGSYGVFLSNRVAIPEPSSWIMIHSASSLVWVVRRRRSPASR